MKILIGICAGIFWALDTVILNLFLEGEDPGIAERLLPFLPLLVTFLHDICSAAYLLFFMAWKKQLKKIKKALFTREGKFVILGALFGGPLGMTGYVLSIRYLGAGNTAMISALFPALGSFMAWIILKEKLTVGQIIGLLLSITGMVLMGGTITGIEQEKFLPRILFALICVCGWASEVIICGYGMKSGVINNEQALTIRQMTSALFYFCIILSGIRGHGAVLQIMGSKGMLIIMAAALAGTVSYLCYYRTIHQLGASTAMALNITYAAWALLFEMLILHTAKNLKEVVCGMIIVGGALISAVSEGRRKNGNL